MRVTVGALVIALVMMFASAGVAVPRNDGATERVAGGGNRMAATADMIVLSSDLGDGSQQLVLVDPRLKSMAVYHLSRGTGQILLKSVRNLGSDLQMDDF